MLTQSLESVAPVALSHRSVTDRSVFVAQLERLRLLTLQAIARAKPERAISGLEADLDACERTLAAPAVGETRGHRLAEALGLDADELGLLWFAVAFAADPLLAPHALVLGGSETRRGANLALYATVADLTPQRVRALSLKIGPSHPLLRYALLEAADGDWVATLSPLRAPMRLCRYLAGEDTVDDVVAAAGGVVRVPDPAIITTDDARSCAVLARTLAGPVPSFIAVQGAEGVGRRTLLARAARSVDSSAVAVDIRRLATGPAVETTLAALRRECLLRGALPVIAGIEDLIEGAPETAPRVAALQRFVDESDGHVALVTSGESVPVTSTRPAVRVILPVPQASVRRAAWQAAIGKEAADLDEAIERAAVRYRMGIGGIEAAVAAARAAARARDGVLEPRDLVEGVRATIGNRFGELAQRLDVRHSWDDLVLPDDILEQIDLLTARARYAYEVLETWDFRTRMARGAGLAALLSGPPGTGKTMVAGLLARALDLDLYQVDLSKVVSKWIGETEKNLSRVLDAADAGHALLLFDEADALFARRTEVKGSNDRYANLEVTHLLQRIEAFGGVAVLTTNLESSIDPALRRRLAAHIVFPKPERSERALLWQRLLTVSAPVAPGIDFDRLARDFPDLAGGTIRNAVVSAAFMAASEGKSIGYEHLERGAWNEYRAMGRVYVAEKRKAR